MKLPIYLYRRTECQYKQRSRISSVGVVTKPRPARPGNSGSFKAGNLSRFSLQYPARLCDAHSLVFYGYRVKHPSIEATQSPTLAPRLRMKGGTPPLLPTSSRLGLSAHIGNTLKKLSFAICIGSFVLQNQKVLLRIHYIAIVVTFHLRACI